MSAELGRGRPREKFHEGWWAGTNIAAGTEVRRSCPKSFILLEQGGISVQDNVAIIFVFVLYVDPILYYLSKECNNDFYQRNAIVISIQPRETTPRCSPAS
jgi:hypothetical protein